MAEPEPGRIQVRPREAPREPACGQAEPEALGRGERVRAALRCPFCRDDVGRRGAVACVRAGCGAIYHRECWEECARDYGGCAVFGCGATAARELSALGWFLRAARLVLAALLFTPRVLAAVREQDRAEVFARALQRARWIHRATNRDSGNQALAVLVLGVPLSYLIVFAVAWLVRGRVELTPRDMPWFMAVLFGVPFLMLVLPFLAAFAALLGWNSLRLAARVLREELAALERGQRPGSVLARLARGVGKKPG